MNKKGSIYFKKNKPRNLFVLLGGVFVFLIVLFINIVNVTSRGVVGDIEKGLIGHWPLNGQYQGKDVTPYGNHGVAIGSTLSTGIKGEGDGSYDFGTVNDGFSINIPNKNFAGLNDFTMSSWIYLKGSHLNYDGTIISSGNWNNSHWSFGISQNNTSIKTRGPSATVPYSFSLNTWYNVVYARQGTTLRFYINGVLVNSYTNTNNIPLASGYTNTKIGMDTYTDNYFNFNGKITDVRIYNRAISSTEAKSLYERYQPSLGASSLNKGLIAHYPLNKESEGNGNVALSTNFFGGPSGWVYTSNVDWSSGKPNMNGIATDSYIMTSANMFIANKTYRVIVDCIVVTGSALASPQQMTSSSILLNHTGKYEYTVTTTTDQRFLIDNVGNTDINMTINSVYISEVNTNNVIPSESNGIVSGAVLSNNRFGESYGAYNFDGVDDYINIGDSARLSSGGTISVWIKPNSTGENLYGRIIDKSTSANSSNGYFLSFYDDKNIGIGINGADPILRADNVILNYNQWYHIVAVLASTKKEIWVNGVLVASNTSSILPPNIAGSVYIGNRADNTDRTFSGSISDLKIYNRVLSANEIKSLYDSFDSKLSMGTLNKGLILNMPLDNFNMQSATVVSDTTPYEHHGTISTGVTVGNTDTLFNGTSGNISMGDMPISSGSKISISIWIKPNSLSGTQEISNQSQWDVGPYTGWRFRQTSGSIDFILGDGSSTRYSYTAGSVSLSNWSHVVGVWDGGYIIIYINGVEVGRSAKSFTYASNNGPHFIGKYAGDAYYYNGSMSDLRIYNRALSASEVRLLYDKGRN